MDENLDLENLFDVADSIGENNPSTAQASRDEDPMSWGNIWADFEEVSRRVDAYPHRELID